MICKLLICSCGAGGSTCVLVITGIDSQKILDQAFRVASGL
jgi:hypothetical protein